MSDEHPGDQQPQESRSSISLTRNAKGDCQPAVKVYEGTTEDEIERIRKMAVDQFRKLEAEFYGGRA